MDNKKWQVPLLFIIILCSITLLFACAPEKSEGETNGELVNYELIDHSEIWLNDDYKIQKVTRGMFIDGTNTDSTDFPKTIVSVISNEEDLDDAFKQFPQDIDFGSKTLVLVFFTCHYMARDYKINTIAINDNILSIGFSSVAPTSPTDEAIGDVSSPQQRCLTVILGKEEFESTSIQIKD